LSCNDEETRLGDAARASRVDIRYSARFGRHTMAEKTFGGARPQLVQFGDLRAAHLDRFSVWASSHSFDYDEEWYDDTDEDTFRPWDGPLPVDPAKGMFLVRSSMTLPNGNTLGGFVTPQSSSEPENLGILQPHVFLPGGECFGFWSGMLGWRPDGKLTFYGLLGMAAADTFPIQFKADEGLSLGRTEGIIEGFYTLLKLGKIQIET
jgi:hypothetical protein